MIEALITMLLIALWVLASAGLQVGSLKTQASAGNRSVAVALVGELSESMDANRHAANAGDYVLSERSSVWEASKNCKDAYCTATELADYDLALWTERAFAALQVEAVSVAKDTGSSGLTRYRIKLSWKEPIGRQNYANDETTETLSFTLTKLVRHDDA